MNSFGRIKMTTTKNKNAKRYPISDRLATDEIGLHAFDTLKNRFEKNADTPILRKEKHFAVLNLLRSLKLQNRLWLLDGTLVD